MKDLKLDTLTHDLVVDDFDFSFVNDVDYYAQKLKIRLWFFLGEWFLDTSVGVPYFQEVLVKNPRVPRIETLLKEIIITTPGIVELVSFNTTYDTITRKFTVSFQARTVEGQIITVQETVP